MEMRTLGRTGLSIAPLVFGGNVFGWTADEKTSFQLLDAFFDAGFNAVDTADAYSTWVPGHQGGESETIIGKWLKQSGRGREEAVIVTKVGSEMGPGRKGLSAKWILQAVEGSLRRLQTDHIDVYLSHWPDAETPYEETLGAYDTLLRQGKVRHIGASNLSAEQLHAALDVSKEKHLPRYAVLQPEYNLYDRASFDGPLRNLCIAEDMGVITYFGLAEVSFRENIARTGTWKGRHAAAASANISMAAACAFWARWMRWLLTPATRRPRLRLPGSVAQGRHRADCQRDEPDPARKSD